MLGPACLPRGPGYLGLGVDKEDWLCVPPLLPQGGAEKIPVILLRPQEALLLLLVKLGARGGKGILEIFLLGPTL